MIDLAILQDLDGIQTVFQEGIVWLKKSQTCHRNWFLRLMTYRCIDAVLLHFEQDMGKVRGGEKIIGKIR